MASVDSTGSSVSGRLRSGDLLHAGLAVALLLGELYFSLYLYLARHSTLYLYIPTLRQNIVLLSPCQALSWQLEAGGNPPVYTSQLVCIALCTFFFYSVCFSVCMW